MSEVRILIIDDDEQSQAALQHVLDSEGWKVRVVPLAGDVLPQLAGGNWTLVIANAAMVGLSGPLFTTLKELALAPVQDGTEPTARVRVRVLFLIPELVAEHAQPALERERLPYALKQLHMHDFLEKVSDLLLEAQVISLPIRRVRHEYAGTERRHGERRSGDDRRATPMFASREDYFMTEEEIAEFEKQEEERRKKEKEKQKED